jgi:hypothetical protein
MSDSTVGEKAVRAPEPVQLALRDGIISGGSELPQLPSLARQPGTELQQPPVSGFKVVA